MEDRHVAVILEDLRGQFRVFGEALGSQNVKLDALARDVADVKVRVAHVETDIADVKVRVAHVEHMVMNGASTKRRPRRSR